MGLRRNITHLLAYQVLTWVVTFVFLIFAPRELGSDAMGAVGYAVAYVGFFALLAGLGTSTVLLRDIARDHTILSQIVFNAVLLKAVSAVLVPAVGISLAWAIG